MIEGIPIKQLWKLFTWLPKFILKRRFTPDILAGLIYVDLRPRHEPATINFGEAAYFELWLQVINLSPFDIELDRAEFQLWTGPILSAAILKRQKISAGEITSLHVQGQITDGQANQLAQTIEGNSVALAGHIDFNCSLHPFQKNVGHLEGVKPKVVNIHLRKKIPA
jgi:hypothetical protein